MSKNTEADPHPPCFSPDFVSRISELFDEWDKTERLITEDELIIADNSMPKTPDNTSWINRRDIVKTALPSPIKNFSANMQKINTVWIILL